MLAHTCYLTDPRVRREAEGLAESGFDVYVISLAEQREGRPEPRGAVVNGVHVHRLPVTRKRGGFLTYCAEYFMTGLLGAIRLALLHFQRKLSVIHIHNMPDILILAAIIPRLSGTKLVLDVHDPMPELYMSWNHKPRSLLVRLLRLQEYFSCWLADRVISVNETMREHLQAKGVASDKILIVHNFPDEKLFPLRDVPPRWSKADVLQLLYCGTVTEHYDLGLAIKALAAVRGEIPVKLKIVGDGNRLSEILALATTLGVRDNIELVKKVPIEKVAEEMRKADVGISCHRGGIFGDLYFSTKIIEYLSQGLPVVCPKTYTISRYLPDDCLFFYEPGNEDALAETLRFLWRNPAEVLARLLKARGLLSRFSWQAEKTIFCDFYLGLLENRQTQLSSSPLRTRE